MKSSFYLFLSSPRFTKFYCITFWSIPGFNKTSSFYFIP